MLALRMNAGFVARYGKLVLCLDGGSSAESDEGIRA